MEVLHGTRFDMFAVCHIFWSIACSPFVPKLLGSDLFPACIAAAVMMLGYLPLGWLSARFGLWSAPNKSQSLWAVFLPAGIAWLWAGTTAFCLYAGGDYTGLAAALGLPAFFLASPSLLFVMTFMGWVGAVFYESGFVSHEIPVMGVGIFLAGLLPPLLYHVGSVLKSKKPETA